MSKNRSSSATAKSGSSSSDRGSSFKVSGTGASSGSGSGTFPVKRLRKPAAVLMDMVGTIMYKEYITKFINLAMKNVKTYLDNNWGNQVLMQDIELLRTRSAQDGGLVIVPDHQGEEEISKSVVNYVKHCLGEEKVKSEKCIFHELHEPMRIFLIHMFCYAVDGGHFEAAWIHPDAVHFLKRSSEAGIHVHIVSRIGSYVAQKFLSKTEHSDLTPYIRSIMDTELGSLEDPTTYKTVAKKIGLPTKDIIFFTHSGVRAVAAHQAGLRVFLVAPHRDDIDREWTEAVRQRQIQVIPSFDNVAMVEDDYEEVEEDEDDEGPSSED